MTVPPLVAIVLTPLVGAATVVVLLDPEGTVVGGMVPDPVEDDESSGNVVVDELDGIDTPTVVEVRSEALITGATVRAETFDDGDLTPADVVASLGGPVPDGSAILLPDGVLVGEAEPDAALVEAVRGRQSALSTYTTDGFGLAIPVITPRHGTGP